MLNIIEIIEIIKAEVTTLTSTFNFLICQSDEDVNARAIRHGIDLTNPQLLKELEILLGGNEAGAQCLRGEGIAQVFSDGYYKLSENIRKFINHAQWMGIIDELLGHVVIYHDAFARNILRDMPNVTRDQILTIVRGTVAHEIRHSFQKIQISYVGLADLVAYATQPHEADAYAFQFAVERGQASIEEAATWVPTQEQLDEVRVVFERIAAQRAAA